MLRSRRLCRLAHAHPARPGGCARSYQAALHDDSRDASAGSPEQEEILRLRAEVARLQLERDDASKGQPAGPPGAGSGLARRIVAIVLVVLTAVLAFATVPALYLRSEVLDTDRYVATVAPLASDPAIQAEIANKVTTQITDAVDIEGITRDAMTELGKRRTPRRRP